MSNSRQRNKSHSAENNSTPAAENVAKKHNKPKGAAPGSSASGVLWKVCNVLFYVGLISVAACSGWFVHSLLGEVSQVHSKLEHLSQQKGELAESVDTLQKQVDMLQKTIGRLEFISKDIQEKQLTNDGAIKKGEKEMEQIGTVLKKMQKDLSSVIQDMKGQGERDLLLFEKTTKEKLTEFTNSINEDISEFTEAQKANENEINNIKAQLASFSEFNSVNDELKSVKDQTVELQKSFQSNQESIEWLINTVQNQNEESVLASNEVAKLRIEHDDLKKDIDGKFTAIDDLKEKVLKTEESGFKAELERLVKKYEQISSAVTDLETNFTSTNDNLLKEIETYQESFEQRLKPLENMVEKLSSKDMQLETIKLLQPNFEEFNRRINAAEKGIADLQNLSTGDAENPQATGTVSTLKEAQLTLSKDIEELKSTVADFPSTSSELHRLQLEVTSVLEIYKTQIEELKYDYDQLKNNAGNNAESPNEGLHSTVTQLETDLKMLRSAVDSLVAYSVKIETNEKDLKLFKDSLEDLQQSTDKLQVKLENIQEKV